MKLLNLKMLFFIAISSGFLAGCGNCDDDIQDQEETTTQAIIKSPDSLHIKK